MRRPYRLLLALPAAALICAMVAILFRYAPPALRWSHRSLSQTLDTNGYVLPWPWRLDPARPLRLERRNDVDIVAAELDGQLSLQGDRQLICLFDLDKKLLLAQVGRLLVPSSQSWVTDCDRDGTPELWVERLKENEIALSAYRVNSQAEMCIDVCIINQSNFPHFYLSGSVTGELTINILFGDGAKCELEFQKSQGTFRCINGAGLLRTRIACAGPWARGLPACASESAP